MGRAKYPPGLVRMRVRSNLTLCQVRGSSVMLRLGKGFETSRVVRSLVKHGYKMDFVNQPKLTGPKGKFATKAPTTSDGHS